MTTTQTIEIDSAEIIEVGDGGLSLMLHGDLLAEIPCSLHVEQWAAKRLYSKVKVTITLATIHAEGG